LDSDVSKQFQPVSRTVSQCFGILRQLHTNGAQCHSLSFNLLLVVAALVLMKTDFGNAMLEGILLFQLDRLQAVMNAVAQLVFKWL